MFPTLPPPLNSPVLHRKLVGRLTVCWIVFTLSDMTVRSAFISTSSISSLIAWSVLNCAPSAAFNWKKKRHVISLYSCQEMPVYRCWLDFDWRLDGSLWMKKLDCFYLSHLKFKPMTLSLHFQCCKRNKPLAGLKITTLLWGEGVREVVNGGKLLPLSKRGKSLKWTFQFTCSSAFSCSNSILTRSTSSANVAAFSFSCFSRRSL